MGVPLLGFAVQLLTFQAYLGAEPDVLFAWQWSMNGVLVSYVALWRLPVPAIVSIAVASGLLPLISGLIALGRIPTAVGLQTPIQVSSFVFAVILLGVRSRFRGFREAEREDRRSEEARVSTVAEFERQADFVRLVHDEVLATLSAVLRFSGEPPSALRALARSALDALRASSLDTGSEPSRAFVDRLIETVGRIDRTCRVEIEERTAEIPNAVAEAMLGALGEAMRNSVRHAGPSAVRAVRARILPDEAVIEIADEGSGFDREAVGSDRLGISNSIVARMAALRGGGSEIESSMGQGTLVRLSWRQIDDTARAEPRAGRVAEFVGNAAAGTGGSGLGTTRGRIALIVVWALNFLYGGLTGSLSTGPWVWGAYAAGLAGAILLTRPGDEALPKATSCCAALSAVLTATAVLSYPVPSGEVWILAYAGYLPALLIARGNPVAGGVGWLAVVLVGLGWCIEREAVPADYMDLFGVLILAVVFGIVWVLTFSRLVRHERRHRSEAGRSRVAQLAAAAAVERISGEVTAVRGEAEPVLTQIAEGALIGPELRGEAAVAEATIRDRIRSPMLQHPMLSETVGVLRRSGVDVLLLGEVASDGQGPERISDALADSIVAEIRELGAGSAVTIRTLAAREAGALSIVVSVHDRRTRLTLSGDGVVLERR